jgi:hypothetical protein
MNGKSLNIFINNIIIMDKRFVEQINRGDHKNLKISSIIIRSVEESDRKINQIPKLDFCEIKEKILESFIRSKK